MNIELIENLLMLAIAVTGLMSSLFRYIESPKRGWLYMTVFFMAHLLSDYYWTIYTLVVHRDPDVSALMAYFGWNVSFVFLLAGAWHMSRPEARRFFHPLMLLPIPINIVQFLIYIPFGGLFNNIWQGSVLTITACICMQSVLYYIKNIKNRASFPFTHTFILAFIITQYGMWTSSCYGFSSPLLDPYLYFTVANCFCAICFAWAIGKDYEKAGIKNPDKSAVEMRFNMVLQIIASAIIFTGGIGGYFVAVFMKNAIPSNSADEKSYSLIAITLFIVSIFLFVLILAVLFVIASRYRHIERANKKAINIGHTGFSYLFTTVITMVLMVFSVVYTSRIFYRISVTGLYDSGEGAAELVATELENYLSYASSTLNVTADTVDFMIRNGKPQEEIEQFLTWQTEQQFKQFDENFTGIYAFVRGEYMDGSGWVPPEGYDVKTRDWYNISIKAGGETVIIPPYVDAQTGSVVITIGKLVSNDRHGQPEDTCNVVALDVIVNHIQDITETTDINNKGYGMVIDGDGLIVAHYDHDLVGKNFSDYFGSELLNSISDTQNGTLKASINGENCTMFVSRIMNQWYIVITVSDSELFEEVSTQLTVNIIVSLIIFALITLFYFLNYKNEKAYAKQMEEMRVSKQKQEYESRVLKLEKKAADEANSAKSNFLADMSHEIRTPINAILGMNEMILREADNPELLVYAKNIDVSGHNLLQLINSILDFSKIEGGKMEIVPIRYNISDVIAYLTNSISERAKNKNLDFHVNVNPAIPSVLFGDDARINQIVLNLLTNAVKYTPEGSVTLTIDEKNRTSERILLYVEVADTGMGIRESDMGRLFQSFERLDQVKNRNIEGTGLGMSITTKLLELMDSKLDVKSTYGEGSVFSFELWQGIEDSSPLGELKMTNTEVVDDDKKYEHLYAPSARILIVDDTQMNIVVAVNLLKRTGIHIDTADSGYEAIKLAEENAYDVILLDQRMPGLSGSQTLKAIKEPETGINKDTPVICLTADAIRGAKERYLADGFNDYLTKPVNGNALEQILFTYIPDEKIGGMAASESGEEISEGDDTAFLYDALKAVGVDSAKGLDYCQDDDGFYREVLLTYASESVSRKEKLATYYSAKDWDNYTIFIHSLKSTSKTIGAAGLFEIAARLEAAAKDHDETAVMREHEDAVALYDRIVGVIKEYISQDSEGDSEILEFKPEG